MAMTIRLADEAGPVLAGRGAAARLRAVIESQIGDEPLVVDFADVVAVSPSFADELFAKLDPTILAAERVRFENVAPAIGSIARYVIAARHGALPQNTP
jgi:hypothetical protein